jgi:hypothetical protein
MIDFLLVKDNNYPLDNELWKSYHLIESYYLNTRKQDLILEGKRNKLILIGDCINKDLIKNVDVFTIDDIINKLKGNFYAFLVNDDRLFVTSSAIGLLPIYKLKDGFLLSSSVKIIKEYSNANLSINIKWIVNQLIFNFQFGHDTYFNEIKLIPTFTYISINKGEVSENKYFSIENEFIKHPEYWQESLDDVGDIFIDITKDYIPDKESYISFTGGFDGRTLVSVASKFKKQFNAFSYGKIKNDDVKIPIRNSKDLNIPHVWLPLDKEYSEKSYLKSALDFIDSTDGGNGFLYAHIAYAAKNIQEKSNYLLTGICGSELFRAVHTSGAVTSKALMDLFETDEFSEYRKKTLESNALKFLKVERFKEAIDSVLEEAWNYKININPELDKNQRLYVFVYEEIFRKFFGAWVRAQMRYINVRAPYVDFDFFKKVIKSEFSGAYSEFLTENPVKRFKGQILYSDIIRKTNNKLFKIKTGKGYAPFVVRIPFFRPLLIIPFAINRLKKKFISTNFDNLGIISGIKYNFKDISSFGKSDYINLDHLESNLVKLNNKTVESDRDSILAAISIIKYQESLNL